MKSINFWALIFMMFGCSAPNYQNRQPDINTALSPTTIAVTTQYQSEQDRFFQRECKDCWNQFIENDKKIKLWSKLLSHFEKNETTADSRQDMIDFLRIANIDWINLSPEEVNKQVFQYARELIKTQEFLIDQLKSCTKAGLL